MRFVGGCDYRVPRSSDRAIDRADHERFATDRACVVLIGFWRPKAKSITESGGVAGRWACGNLEGSDVEEESEAMDFAGGLNR